MTDYNDGKIHGWNGGECPVHPESRVTTWHRNKLTQSTEPDDCWWDHKGTGGDIIAFQVVKQFVEPKVIWVNEYPTTKSGWDSEADAKKYAMDAKRIAVKYVEAIADAKEVKE